jgi:glycosyltransferase involved in cell wall biosynthesis
MLDAESDMGGKLRRVAKAVRDLVPAVFEQKRLAMIDCSDRVAVVSPPAAASVAAYAAALGYPGIAAKLLVAPHPVSPLMTCPSEEKAPKVLVVGRWLAEDRGQKDPELTMAVLGKFLEASPAWTAEVVGRGSTTLRDMTNRWNDDAATRLTLTEAVPRTELIGRYRQSRILLCCSRHESFHISSAEALCCGCSVVVADHPLLASTGWFTTKDSGTLSPTRSASALTNALLNEAEAWKQYRRNPQHIACGWQDLLHANRVAEGILAASGRQR